MARACLIAREAMAAVTPHVVPGISMPTLVERVEHELLVRGSRCPSFPTHIFTWGERRLDSGGAGKLDALRDGEVVLFDFGAVWNGYCSDFGRTVPCGEPPAELRGRAPCCSRRRRRAGRRRGRARSRAMSTPPAAPRSRPPGSATASATGWATGSVSTCTSGRSSRSRTRRRSRRG